ncbi:MAG TPA: DUF4350 domain-containing protein, partial [Labilithrix sp.]|nr:DUF4350 domain-containing protein [Labilithrix sp.]
CKAPSRPLGVRQQGLCPLAAEIEGCEGFAEACALGLTPKDRDWLERIATFLAPIAHALLYLLVLGVGIVLAIPVVKALRKRRRARKLGEAPAAVNRAVAVESVVRADEISDAEASLLLADEHRRRGDLKRALGLYLAASLAALDRRGAIRLARHRTNGEYVRACGDEASRGTLREIVREVDQVEFGGGQPTEDGVARVASRAAAIVRVGAATMAVLTFALFGAGCGAPRKGANPAGAELPTNILERNGYDVRPLGSSLATMPIPEADQGTPVVIVDLEKVPLEEEARAHVVRWVEAGGVLVLFGEPGDWPATLRGKHVTADTHALVVRARDPNGGLEDLDAEEEEEEPTTIGAPVEIDGARTARRDAFAWTAENASAETIGFLGKEIYASKRRLGKGIVLGIANDDLFTNVGVMPRRNAAALVTLIRAASHDPGRKLTVLPSGAVNLGELRIARAEDGVPPPSNPFAALVAAGLGKGAWHALAASILLFLAYGIRQARPRMDEKRGRRVFAEHIVATGAFYERTRAHAHALGAYGRFMDLRLREALPRGSDPVAFLASHSDADPARIAELYARATTAKADDEARGDELVVIEELRRMVEKALTSRSR